MTETMSYRVKRKRCDGWEYARKTKYSLVWGDEKKATIWKRKSDLSNAFAQGRLAHLDVNSFIIEEVQIVVCPKAHYKHGWIPCE